MSGISYSGIDKTLSVLTALASQKTANDMEEAAAKSYVNDTLTYINNGLSFTPRTGTLQRSIGYRQTGNETVIQATAPYASAVEFGHPSVLKAKNSKNTKAYPFLFADIDARKQRSQAATLSVLESLIKIK